MARSVTVSRSAFLLELIPTLCSKLSSFVLPRDHFVALPSTGRSYDDQLNPEMDFFLELKKRELAQFSRCLACATESLARLLQVLQGVSACTMTASLQELEQSLCSQTVPPQWRLLARCSRPNLLQWLHQVAVRSAFLDEWIKRDCLPSPVDLNTLNDYRALLQGTNLWLCAVLWIDDVTQLQYRSQTAFLCASQRSVA